MACIRRIMCSNLVWRKHASSLSSSLSNKLFVLGRRPEKAAVIWQQQQPQPWWRARNLSSFAADPSSLPSLMLTPEVEEEENVVPDATTATEKTLNFRFLSPAAAPSPAGDHHDVVKLKKKFPQPLLRTRCVGSSHGWLAYRYLNCDPDYYIKNSAGFYLVNLLSPTTTMSPEIIPLPSSTSPSIGTQKVALSSAPNEKNKCVIFHIDVLDDLVDKDQLAFCRIGDSSWTILDSPLADFSDVVYSKKNQLFYVLAHWTGDIEAWDFHSSSSSSSSPRRIETEIEYPYPPLSEDEEECRADADIHYQYLVESPSGDILRIMRYVTCTDGTFRFDVYKLDFRRHKGEYLDSLGDIALFLGHNHSFALSVRDYPWLNPNSIYFVDEHVIAGAVGVYNLEDDSIQPLYSSHLNKILCPLMWLAPNP